MCKAHVVSGGARAGAAVMEERGIERWRVGWRPVGCGKVMVYFEEWGKG